DPAPGRRRWSGLQELAGMQTVHLTHQQRVDAVADELLHRLWHVPSAVDTESDHEVLLLAGPAGRVLERDAEARSLADVRAAPVDGRAEVQDERPGRRLDRNRLELVGDVGRAPQVAARAHDGCAV